MPAKKPKKVLKKPAKKTAKKSAAKSTKKVVKSAGKVSVKKKVKTAVKAAVKKVAKAVGIKTTPSTEGKPAPSFSAESTGEATLNSTDLKGQKYVIYFYPKDNTEGCTAEGEKFRDLHFKFKEKGIKIFGVSRDSIASHEGFKSKHQFPFDLLSDPDEKLCKAFNVMQMKSMYGKKFLGVERSTFFVNAAGIIQKEWRKVSVPGHVEEVLNYVSNN